MYQNGTLGNMYPVIPLRVNDLLNKLQVCVWYQDEIYLAEHRIVVIFQLRTTVRKKLKHPNNIDKKQWKKLEKEGRNMVINTSDTKEVV